METLDASFPTRERAIEMLAQAEERHRRRNVRSLRALEQLAGLLPGGDTRSTTWFDPFPPVIESAVGAEMVDCDGHILLDFIGNYTSLVHGHAPATVTESIVRAVARGTVFAAPMLEQGELASRLCDRIGSVQRIRFTNSGTEANLLAGRIARAFTGRHRLAVARHSYHGSWPDLDWHAAASTGTATFPIDDREVAAAALGDGEDLAAVFIEPVLGSGGVIEVEDEMLAWLRELTERCGALLVFDEVMTVRLGYGGRQGKVGVCPDLTTLGKPIGGGLPIGAVGGRDEVMAMTEPGRNESVVHSGTFNGNRLAMVAGAAALDLLDQEAIAMLDRLAAKLVAAIENEACARELPISITSSGSMMNVHALPGVAGPDLAQRASAEPLARLMHLLLLEHGLFIASRGELCTSTAMDEGTIDRALSAFSAVFAVLSNG